MLYLFDDYTLDTQLYELRHAGARATWSRKSLRFCTISLRIGTVSSPARNSLSTSGQSASSVKPRWTIG